ncbi:MAG: pantetheine-phosphate adenylyltransferase [Ruminococcaceae bacterium]|nr:pantetheine-phosphate adenylyltransferase [Oscillospiraceae bacterium]
MTSEKKLRSAIVPGSFDPITLGHLDVVRRAAILYDRVYLALLINPEKSYFFDLDTRVRMAEMSCADIPNVSVVSDSGLLVDLAKRLGCEAIIKGVRDENDFKYEMKMALCNRELAPDIETLLLPCDKRLADVSSTRVRELIEAGDRDGAAKLLHTDAVKIIFDTED